MYKYDYSIALFLLAKSRKKEKYIILWSTAQQWCLCLLNANQTIVAIKQQISVRWQLHTFVQYKCVTGA